MLSYFSRYLLAPLEATRGRTAEMGACLGTQPGLPCFYPMVPELALLVVGGGSKLFSVLHTALRQTVDHTHTLSLIPDPDTSILGTVGSGWWAKTSGRSPVSLATFIGPH